MDQTIQLQAELWEAEQMLASFDEASLVTDDETMNESAAACFQQLKANVQSARRRVVDAQSHEGPRPTRKQLEHALASAQAQLESPRSGSDQVFGTGVIEGDLGDAPVGSRALIKEIASIERALNAGEVLAPDDPGDIRH